MRQPVIHGKAAACVHVQGGVLLYREDCARHHLVGVVHVVHAVGQNHFKGVGERQHHFFRAEALQAEHARSCAAAYGDGAYARVGIDVGGGGAARNVPCAVVRFGEIRALFEHYQPRPKGEVGVAVVAHHQHVLRGDCAQEVQACHAYFPCAVVDGELALNIDGGIQQEGELPRVVQRVGVGAAGEVVYHKGLIHLGAALRRNYAAAGGKPVAVIGGAALEHYFAVVDQFAVCAGGVSLRRLVGIVAHSPHHQRAVDGKRYAAVYRKRAVQILLRRLLGVPRNAVYGVFRAARFRKGARRAIGNKQRHPDGNGQVFRYLFVPQQHHRVAADGGCKRLLQVGVKYAVYACGIVVLRHYYGSVPLLVRHYHAERFRRGNKLARTVQPAVEGVAVAGRCRKRYSSALRYAVAAVDAARHRTVFAARDVVYDACPVEKAHVAYRRNIQPFRPAAVFGVGKVYRGLLVFGGGNFKGVLRPAAVVAYFFDVGT